MKSTAVCGQCGSPGIKVSTGTVQCFAKKDAALVLASAKNKWHACPNPQCAVVYYSGKKLLHAPELRAPVWYKDAGPDAPVCYCGNLLRKDIQAAAAEGCVKVSQVLKHSKKKMTKKCERTNPLGRCCKSALEFELAAALKASGQDSGGTS